MAAPLDPPVARAATFRDVFADREFRAIWLAELASIAGDQFARVALTVVVFQRTGSPLLTALTYASTYLPWLVGGLFLSDLADRFPRRTVMITADVARMLLVAAMAAPGMPLWGMVLLLFVVASLNGPFQGARSALRASIMPDDRYTLGLAASQVTREFGVVGGFVAGGLIVSVLGGRTALLIDAGTFAVSALLLSAFVRHRPAAGRRRQARLAEMMAGLRLVFATDRLRPLMLLGWLCAFYTVPEALAVPYAAQLHHGVGRGRADLRRGAAGERRGHAGVHPGRPPGRAAALDGPDGGGRLPGPGHLPGAPGPDPAAGHFGRVRPAGRLSDRGQRGLRAGVAGRPARSGLRLANGGMNLARACITYGGGGRCAGHPRHGRRG